MSSVWRTWPRPRGQSRSDVTIAVDWAFKTDYLSIRWQKTPQRVQLSRPFYTPLLPGIKTDSLRGGSMGRALASRSNGFHDQRFESRPEHKKKL